MYSKKKVVCIGGGTGLSTMLRGLKQYTKKLTAVVTVADNGGSSGMLRRDMGILPPGDIRNCILALAETEPLMNEIFQYRFREGSLEGQNLGNLLLAAMTDIYGSFECAVEKANEVLAVKGQVIPVTTEDVQLEATYEDGTRILGEHEIVYTNKVVRKKISDVRLVPERPKAYSKAVKAISKADLVVLGPGSLFTSIIPNLLVEGIGEAVRKSDATVVYVGNIMTQPGETDNFTLRMHVDEIEKYLGRDVIHHVVADDTRLAEDVECVYREDDAIVVKNDLMDDTSYDVIRKEFAIWSNNAGYVRHDAKRLAEVIIGL